MDDAANSSPSKLQLLSINEQLKRRAKDLEQLYTTVDEERCQEIEKLIQQRDELAEKLENLQNKMYNSQNFSSTLSLEISSYPTQNGHETSAESYPLMHNSQSFTSQSIPSPPLIVNDPCDSYAEDYANLKANFHSLSDDYTSLLDSFRSLSDEKSEMEKKVNKMDDFVESLQQIIEQLRLKDTAQEELIERLKAANVSLNKSYEDLYKNAYPSPLQEEVSQETNLFLGMSLFDEIKEVENNKSDSEELLHLTLPSLSEDEESGYGDCINLSDSERYEVKVLYNELALARKRDALDIKEMKERYEKHIKSLEKEINQFKSERGQLINVIDGYSTQICDLKSEIKSKDKNFAFWNTLLKAILIFAFLFFIIYTIVCVHQEVPLFFFINPCHFNFKQVTYRMPPM